MNTKISYLYRDADNYKVYNECVINGSLSFAQQKQILNSLHEGEWFIPSAVGLPENQFDTWTEADHPWFELGEYSFEDTNASATVDLSPAALTKAFILCKDRWPILEYDKTADLAASLIGDIEEIKAEIGNNPNTRRSATVPAIPTVESSVEKYEPFQKLCNAYHAVNEAIEAADYDYNNERRFSWAVRVGITQAKNALFESLLKIGRAQDLQKTKLSLSDQIQTADSRTKDVPRNPTNKDIDR